MKKFIAIIIVFIFCAAQIVFAQDKLIPETLWKLGRVGDPQLSPDGKECLYNIRSYKLDANKGNSDTWKINLATNAVTKLAGDTTCNETSAKWSSDGKKIFFLNDKGGTSALWSMNADGSNSTQESKLDKDINAYGISANGNMIWLAMDVKIDKSVKDLYPDLPKATGRIYDDLNYRHWDTWADGTYSHIFISKFNDGKIKDTPKDIQNGERFDTPMKPDGGEEEINWNADGTKLAYTCKKLFGKDYAVSTNSDIYIYDMNNGSTANLTMGMAGYDKAARFSPDGKMIAWVSQEEAGNEADRVQLFVFNFTTSVKRELTIDFDYSVNSFDWNKSGSLIYFLAGIHATDNLFSYDFSPKTKTPVRQITNDVADHNGFTVSSNEKKEDVVVTSRMDMLHPTELFSIDLKSGASKEITFTNKDILSALAQPRIEKRMIKATDGKDILTWVIYPPNFDAKKKYPALLYCQGGPQSTVSQFFSYRWNFMLMASNGYIIVAPNRRGLPSFGEKWNDDISLDWGGQAMKDLLSAIDSVSQEPYINKDKLGAVGASFGGYSVFWLAGNHKKRFKAFIAHDGVFNLSSMNASTEELWFPHHEFGGQSWNTTRPDNYENFSPNKFVQHWDTPILIVHNEKDFRVPVEQGMEAYTAARLQNVPARFLCFPDENHWVLKPQNSVLWQRVFYDWLDRWLK